jgi:anti-sigma regulatory factor (Ser/Thr protein kinase)
MHDPSTPAAVSRSEWTRVTVPAGVAHVGPAVNRLRDWLRAHGSRDGEALEGVMLAVSEALTNAIRHGGSSGAEACVHLAWIWRDCDLELEVSEPGMFIPPPTWSNLPDDPLAESGRGGFLITRLMDTIEHRNADGRHALRMHKRLERASDATTGNRPQKKPPENGRL